MAHSQGPGAVGLALVAGLLAIGCGPSVVAPPPTSQYGSLSAGWYHACGLGGAGIASCWGADADGQLGDGAVTDSTTMPVAVNGLTFAAVSSGGDQTCALTVGGTPFCWGFNGNDALGTDSVGDSSATPVAVSGGFAFIAVSSGAQHACGLTSGGAAYCWGANTFGQLGVGTPGGLSATPESIAGSLTFTSLSSGGLHTCGLTAGGRPYCWGDNVYGGSSGLVR